MAKLAYGADVEWKAGEIAAFREYNAMCGAQAKAVFAWNMNPVGPKPITVQAPELAARARAMVQA